LSGRLEVGLVGVLGSLPSDINTVAITSLGASTMDTPQSASFEMAAGS
jgi:hypothetical protein